ncbi:hypothetical protein U3516DRAFT_914239 [Neocallimastix sp. 'constans']
MFFSFNCSITALILSSHTAFLLLKIYGDNLGNIGFIGTLQILLDILYGSVSIYIVVVAVAAIGSRAIFYFSILIYYY